MPHARQGGLLRQSVDRRLFHREGLAGHGALVGLETDALQHPAVGGDHVKVTSVTPTNVEPHDFELSPKDVTALSDTGLVVYVAGFQPSLDDALSEVSGPTVLDLSDAVDLTHHDGVEHDHEDGDDDEHADTTHAEHGEDADESETEALVGALQDILGEDAEILATAGSQPIYRYIISAE